MAIQNPVTEKQQSGATAKAVPAGFKLTEVGVIPEDWEIKAIGQLNPFITSGSRGWADFYVDYGDLFIRITNMSRNSIYLDTKTCENKFVSLPVSSTEGKRTQLNNGDILISITADIGIVGYIDESIAKPAYINQHISLVRFDDDSIDNKFVAYFLASENVQKKLLANSDLGAKAGMNLNGVRSIIFAVPTKKEQSAIAKALTDIDALIVELKKNLTKKQSIKTATMQQLLTGKTRLPQFALREDGTVKRYKKSELGEIPEDWSISTYGQVFSFLSTSTNARSDLSDTGEYGYIHYGDIHTKWNNTLNLENNILPRISRDLITSSFVENGDLIMADASEDYTGIGKSTEIKNVRNNKIVAGLHTYLLRDTNNIFADGFRGYLHSIRAVKTNIDRLATGMKVFGISKNNLKTIPIPVPPKEEQTAIAAILSDMDKDIQTLQQCLDKTRQLKQGMMQELLTGKIRLIEKD